MRGVYIIHLRGRNALGWLGQRKEKAENQSSETEAFCVWVCVLPQGPQQRQGYEEYRARRVCLVLAHFRGLFGG